MSASSFGQLFRIQSFGESHGVALGVVIDGCPAGLEFDEKLLRNEMERRRPGASSLKANAVVSPRGEMDQVEILSGVFEGRTLGTPIAMMVRNQDARSEDYEALRNKTRAGHADDVWTAKFGHRDHRGGGRSSGRETVARVMAGSVAKMLIRRLAPDLRLHVFASEVGRFVLNPIERAEYLQNSMSKDRTSMDAPLVDSFVARFPSAERGPELQVFLEHLRAEGDSCGGVADIVISGVPVGLGQPVFHKLKSDLAMAMMSVGASSAFEVGEGLHDPETTGRSFHEGNPYGGIRGGISTGELIQCRVHMKPTSSILDVAKQGRHDPCILVRALPVFESMAALVIADHLMWRQLDRV